MALCQASEVYLRRSATPSHQDEKILKAALANYGRAVTLLRHKLASSKYVPSESATATSSALATFDLLIADGADDKIGHSASFAHFEACKCFLEAQSQNPSSTPTTIARAFFQDYCRFELFRVCSLGKLNAVTASICENTYWSGMEPFSLAPLPSNYASLQRASHEIDLRLARLTQYVRELRDGDDISASQVTALADLLLEFENLPAENETLHQVRVVPTRNIAERHIVPVSFDFDSPHWPMLIHYWATLLTLVRLCLLIDFLARKEHHLSWLDEDKTAKLVATQQRAVSNLLMSRQYAFDRSIVARLQVVHPLVLVWATLAGKSTTPQGLPVVTMKQWILTQLQRSGVSFLRDWTGRDLDNATEIFEIPDRLKQQKPPD
ncbi:hypothetical protein M409DRAFT_23016 [Zasmidium cellare ATCC 36951]|uniref:Uncharacterized protein n=1 Tax=Zasmidium cellare ATCC 36951 TaxID=1080233 RepID=A0A6A6CM23_ZASCE|nr:uncharacterized protein M409DRAFT_23016 [Zasmidium cellare ATCC 36951]KAF2166972.1 hypothetical protein M409DRAFT_23016 [Zasmidium cellare ATCC 36951]